MSTQNLKMPGMNGTVGPCGPFSPAEHIPVVGKFVATLKPGECYHIVGEILGTPGPHLVEGDPEPVPILGYEDGLTYAPQR